MQDSWHELPSCFHSAWETSQEKQCSRRGLKEGQKEAGKEEAASLKQAGQVLPETARTEGRPSRSVHHHNTLLPTELQGASEEPYSLSHTLYSFTCGIQA